MSHGVFKWSSHDFVMPNSVLVSLWREVAQLCFKIFFLLRSSKYQNYMMKKQVKFSTILWKFCRKSQERKPSCYSNILAQAYIWPWLIILLLYNLYYILFFPNCLTVIHFIIYYTLFFNLTCIFLFLNYETSFKKWT